MIENERPFFVASHRRSGTHLTLDSLVVNFDYFQEGFENFDVDVSSKQSRLYKTHLDGAEATTMLSKNAKVVYVVRDGRDVMVSLYNYSKSLDANIKQMSFSDFLRSPNSYSHSPETDGLNRLEYWNYHVQSWLSQEQFPTKFVSFDGWKHAFENTVSELATYLELPPKEKPQSMVMTSGQGLAKKIMRRIGLSKTTAIQFRGGRSEQWKEVFDEPSLDYFRETSADTYQALVEKIGPEFQL